MLEFRVEISSKTRRGFLYDLVKGHCRGRISSGNNDDALYDCTVFRLINTTNVFSLLIAHEKSSNYIPEKISFVGMIVIHLHSNLDLGVNLLVVMHPLLRIYFMFNMW